MSRLEDEPQFDRQSMLKQALNAQDEGKQIIERLAGRLDNGYKLTGDLLEEVMMDPERFQKARSLGLIPEELLSD